MITLAITGGTGSLGKAILKHQTLLKENGIERIRIISRDEIKQDDLEKSYIGDIELQCILGDVRSRERMEMALSGCQYVIHAAALKIAPKVEYDVAEAVRTNVSGTENVLKSFLQNKDATSGIFVSTDKAVDPVNAYGFSKATAERIWLWGMMFQNQTKLSVCRYGNVFGSRGSIVFHWARAIERDEPMKITDPRMTRFFIRLNDAAEFVLRRLFQNQGGEIYVPKMSSALMMDVGEALCAVEGKTPDWVKIGLREGEKIHEVLTSVNDKSVFGDPDNSWHALRVLPSHTKCYRGTFSERKLDDQITSEFSKRLSPQLIAKMYREWKDDYRWQLG